MNNVVDGDYKGQGVMIWRETVVITLPMFRTVKINAATVAGYELIDDKMISVRFRDGKHSVLKVSKSIRKAIIAALPSCMRSFDGNKAPIHNDELKQTKRSRFITKCVALAFLIAIDIPFIKMFPQERNDPLYWIELFCFVGATVALLYSILPTRRSVTRASAIREMSHQEDSLRRDTDEVQIPTPIPSLDINIDQIIQDEKDWRREQMGLTPVAYELEQIDHMSGAEFERWCAELLSKLGFEEIELTPGSNDQGVDIVAVKEEIRYAIQCKCYSSDLGNTPVQAVNTGKAIYHCQVGAVITNRYFTKGGQVAAKANGVLLWDRNWIHDKLEELGN